MGNQHLKVEQMAHLKQRHISDSSCKTIIIDTLLESAGPISQDELSEEIASVFHVLVSKERLVNIIIELVNEKILYTNKNNQLCVTSSYQVDFLHSKQRELELQNEAIQFWIDLILQQEEVSPELKSKLKLAMPIFLRSLFIRHGISSYELLTQPAEYSSFDIKEIATTVSQQYRSEQRDKIAELLPTIFHQSTSNAKVMEYLRHGIDKAVGYISEVISDENAAHIRNGLQDLTLYLDTNVLYRLLNLQGQGRYNAIKETLDFCKFNGVTLKVSAQTKKELSNRLTYDAKVLKKYPGKTNLYQMGYKYRTSDNYISTYWTRAESKHLSVDDFILYYQNFDILLGAEKIDIEDIEVDEERLITRVKDIFEKLSLNDTEYEKDENGLWHDAYNFAYVQKMQKADAKTAIDTRCLFLTTDQALISLQRKDYELSRTPPVVISPAQLLQIFSFSRPGCGYEETFIKYFASSSIGQMFKYNNEDIQEIISRISHYRDIPPEIAEEILARQLINSQYMNAEDETKREEIIYKYISDELMLNLETTTTQVSELQLERDTLGNDYQTALRLIKEAEEEKTRLQGETQEANILVSEKETKLKIVEEEKNKAEKYSRAQQDYYIDRKWKHWKRRHLWLFWLSVIAIPAIIAISVYANCSGLLAILAIPVATLAFGTKVFSAGIQVEIRQKYLDDYKRELGF